MSFYIKRLFLTPYCLQDNFPDKTIYLKSTNNYIKSKFISALSDKLYNTKSSYIFFHDNFKTNSINTILIPELNYSISSCYKQKSSHIINLNSLIKGYSQDNIKIFKDKLIPMHKDFSNIVYKLNNLFSSICIDHSLNLNKHRFQDFKYEFINYIFKNAKKENNPKIFEYFISSIGIKGFKSFSSYLPNNENKVFVINDVFNTFKPLLLNKILNKAKDLNVSIEVYRNPLNMKIIDHIKIPSLNVCIISNDFLFNEKVPGVQINLVEFSLNKTLNSEVKLKEENLKNLVVELNYICHKIQKSYSILYNYFDNYVVESKFNNLLSDTLKNVIH